MHDESSDGEGLKCMPEGRPFLAHGEPSSESQVFSTVGHVECVRHASQNRRPMARAGTINPSAQEA
jgi:hypothetical protein